ncbi:BtpA/SgcQ family protein [Rhodococcus sp. WS3]|uniref:BtpA/SgcQ family protein n=1 Tax=unclassified Rhodococcus (in: high G+C Gram-positive bacteria) TaxID=192944 RepID=UPI0005D44BA5|nr:MULTISPECIES: BtpA/SgcQ family protein [unclassified Rhodococcus (in: high G+C Gram-positive bacteria)]KJF19299.1 putative sgc region protein SgcQ [Rhodococcus sp. AD45]ROZ42745.1 BtpA/SgcQ family protein [Rhodococcus sp. WS3]RZL21768.1 MAG: BtpA/SgcQ family protein [Rhodococcus sp. (in: high G+C Gram-positive bacteria)]
MTPPKVHPVRPSALREIFARPKPIIGVVHLGPLPGSPRYNGERVRDIYADAVRDAKALAAGGIDGIMVENASDMPFSRPEDIGHETVAALTAACIEITDAVDTPIGITCVANGVIPGLAVAKATGAQWVRANQWVNAYIANEGFMNGPAAPALRYRKAIGAADVAILADVHVKFGAHAITADRSISEQATDAEWFDADVLIATGTRTGSPTSPAEVEDVRAGTNLPVIVGSGMDPEQLGALFEVADGAIVGQWLKEDGLWWNRVDQGRVEKLMAAADAFRQVSA